MVLQWSLEEHLQMPCDLPPLDLAELVEIFQPDRVVYARVTLALP